VLQQVKERWKCVGLAPSYAQFIELANGTPVDWSKVPSAGRPDVDALLAAARTLLGGDGVDLVTIDMPVALTPIRKRREADSAVSQKFGSKGLQHPFPQRSPARRLG